MTKNNLALSLILVSSLNSFASDQNSIEYSQDWKFQLAPMFFWGMNIKGDSQIGPVTAPLDLAFKDDIFENLSMLITLHFEAHKGDWGFISEYQYVNLEPSTTSQQPPIKSETDFTIDMLELGGSYTFSRTDSMKWEALAGLRYTKQKNETKINGTTLIDVSEDWTDFFIGGRNYTKFSDKWLFIGRADIGAGGSDFVWNVSMMADYRFNDWGSAFVGYKWTDYNYDNGKSDTKRYTYNALQQGPLIGLNIHW